MVVVVVQYHWHFLAENGAAEGECEKALLLLLMRMKMRWDRFGAAERH